MNKVLLAGVAVIAIAGAAYFAFAPNSSNLKKGIEAYLSEDFDAALPIFRELADQGDAGGQAWLADAYFRGSGIEADEVEAERLFRLSALQGHPEGQKGLGYIYYNNGSFEKDAVLSYMWISVSLSNEAELLMLPLSVIENDLSEDELMTAQTMAQECISSNYSDCGY